MEHWRNQLALERLVELQERMIAQGMLLATLKSTRPSIKTRSTLTGRSVLAIMTLSDA